jgi:FdrA protein
VDDEVRLKQQAASQGLLVMGPDCGTAIVAGVGLGFANQVRRGPVGLVGASGTGLQFITARIHELGSGVSHALGVGGPRPECGGRRHHGAPGARRSSRATRLHASS